MIERDGKVEVFVYSDCSFYKSEIKNILSKIFIHQDDVHISYFSTFETFPLNCKNSIFILDIGLLGTMEFCRKVRSYYRDAPIILLTSFQTSEFLLSSFGPYTYHLSKMEICKRLETILVEVLSQKNQPQMLSLEIDNIKVTIPLHDIIDFFYSNKKVCIHARNSSLENYTYTLELSSNQMYLDDRLYVLEQGKIHFSFSNVQKFSLEKTSIHPSGKSYSKTLKKEVQQLRKDGVSTQTIQKTKHVSRSTIYRWQKEGRMEEELQSLQSTLEESREKLSNYQQIEDIVKGK